MAFLKLNNLTRRFGGLVAVNDLSFEIEQGKVTGLIGPNGSGKSTTINLISGVLPVTSGTVEFMGQIITGKPAHQIARLGIARTYQQIRVFDSLTALENVQVARSGMYRSNLVDVLSSSGRLAREEAREREKAMELIKLVGLAGKEGERPHNLPYGFRRYLEIARALATNPELLLLDEPAAGMNPAETAQLTELIKWIREKFNLTILLIEHDMSVVMKICERIYVLDYGILIAEGTPDEIRSNPRVIEAYLGEDVSNA